MFESNICYTATEHLKMNFRYELFSSHGKNLSAFGTCYFNVLCVLTTLSFNKNNIKQCVGT
jgi:hypothetical protein